MVLVGILGLFLLTGPGAAHANGLVDGAVMVLATIAVGSLSLRMDREARAIASSAMEGEDRYRLLADNTTDLITRHDALGKVEFASPAARALLRVAPATILGNGLFDRVHVADRPAYLGALRRSYENRTAATVEFRLRRDGPEPAGEVIDVEMRCRPAAAADGTVNAVVAVTRDVSERKAYERELREARETADRANQAKSHFLAHMSHELRTPLNAIIGFAGILKGQAAGFDALERQREYATLIHGAGEHLLHVVNGILDMSKIESGTVLLSPEPLAIPPLVDACCDLMAHQASEAGVKLNRAKADELPAIVADHSACRQMVINLLSNAIKFTEAGGSVTVGARVEGGMMEIYVRDTGIGIAEEDLARIGTPFVQADSSYRRRFQGTGLGLSMVKSLAEMHGGRLKIESRLGRGTVASIVLPLQMAPVEAPPVPGADVLQTLRPIEKERRLG
jgi:cell cycle sensor histidine kinase DivJ